MAGAAGRRATNGSGWLESGPDVWRGEEGRVGDAGIGEGRGEREVREVRKERAKRSER